MVEKRRKQASGGNTPDPDTSYETLLGQMDINLQETRKKTNTVSRSGDCHTLTTFYYSVAESETEPEP